MEINNYYVAKSLDEALMVFKQRSDNYLIGGGAWMKNSLKQINELIELSHLVSSEIINNADFIEIGAMCTLHQLSQYPLLNTMYDGIIAQACQLVMGITIQNIATIGGTIMGSYAFSDLLTPLLAIDCILNFHHLGKISLSDYLLLTHHEKDILLSILIEKKNSKGYFHKVSRTALDFSILNLAIIRENHQFKIVVGARPGIATFANEANRFLSSNLIIDKDILMKASQLAANELSFSSNFRAQAEYRKSLAQTYILRGLLEVTKDVS